MMTFGKALENRENNFNFMRMFGASVIVYMHCYFVLMDNEFNADTYPFLWDFGSSLLNLFFTLSGALMTMSILTRKDIIFYCVSRALRLFPALIVVSLFVAVVVGPHLGSLSYAAYFSDFAWVSYFFKTSTTMFPNEPLPGALQQSVDSFVNAPLWTLRYEFLLYAALLIAWILGSFRTVTRFNVLALICFLAYLAVSHLTSLREIDFIDHLVRFAYAFLVGAVFYINRDKIIASNILSLGLLASVLVLRNFYDMTSIEFFVLPAMSYFYFYFCLIPSKGIKHYRKLGDYSYGVYILHYPIQQLLVFQFGIDQILMLFALSWPLAVILAILSWSLIEKTSLAAVKPVTHAIKAEIENFDWMKIKKRIGMIFKPANTETQKIDPESKDAYN